MAHLDDVEKDSNLLPDGLYDSVVSTWLASQLSSLGQNRKVDVTDIDEGDSHDALARYLTGLIRSTLANVRGQEQNEQRAKICNDILHVLAGASGDVHAEEARLPLDVRRLERIYTSYGVEKVEPRPDTPLSLGALLTGTRLDPTLLSQLRKEIRTSDRIDVLCSFIKWSGLRILEDDLRAFLERPNARLRFITTSYMGATDYKAVEWLRKLPQTEVRVSYDIERTRLHAKAYVFERNTGFGTAYIGSSNLSRPALTEGLEWNSKISQVESPHLWEKIRGTFDTYWNDKEFVALTEAELPTLRAALVKEQRPDEGKTVFFDLRPYAFQQEILDRLQAERTFQNRNRHLVVSATGTGKTMVAAFDYRGYADGHQSKPRLLFVAHREEILEQSLQTFRAVLRDNNFGDLLVGGRTPQQEDHLFVSIQSYNSRRMWEYPADHFDYVVVDEFHHAGARTYRRLLDHVQPQVLLGLTATPERADGWNVLNDFGGHLSAEIRLPEAINRGLLCPFHYFGVSDTIDYSNLNWRRGGYDTKELEDLLTGNDIRADLIIQQLQDRLLDIGQARGLGFCVSVAHAHFMAAHFQRRGLKAAALTGDASDEARTEIPRQLRRREINFLFTVDLFNEGVDIPEVDTVLFLRPTESLTVFLQQLGRGLRLHDSKDCLTVLDFIGQSHRQFRFDLRFRALLSDQNHNIQKQIEQGFPFLPSGCSISLEKVAQRHILNNIKGAVLSGVRGLERELKAQSDNLGRVPSLAEFLETAQLPASDLYRRVSYARLVSHCGLGAGWNEPDEDRLTKGLYRLSHIDDPTGINTLLRFLHGSPILEESEHRRVLMLLLTLFTKANLPANLESGLKRLELNPTLRQELIDLLKFRLSLVSEVPPSALWPYPNPLEVHAQYTRDEILAALGDWTFEKQPDVREGVRYLEAIKTDIFFVTLDKTEGDYSPTTMYEDYAISENLFHWQSQSTTSAESKTGGRYIHGGASGHQFLLFVREKKQVAGQAPPYAFLGPAEYVEHTGSRPMSILWRLKYAIPARLRPQLLRMAA